jgi:hypothetical protein
LAKRPEYSQVPIASLVATERQRVVDAIVTQVEDGIFYEGSLLVDLVLRDDRIRGVLMQLVQGLLGKQLELEPAKDNGTHRSIADEIEVLWPAMFEESALVELVTWGITLGVGLAQVVWQDGVPWLDVWHPWALRWDDFLHQYVLQTRENSVLHLVPADHGFTDETGGQWLLFTPYGCERPGRRGLLRSLAPLYLERRLVRRDRSSYLQIHGKPLRFGIAPEGANKADIDDFNDSLSNLDSESSITARQGPDGKKWDVKLIEASAQSHAGFTSALAELDHAIAVLLLGQAQTTDGQQGLGANAEAGEPVRGDLLSALERSLSHTLREQFLKPYCQFAYGSAERAPYPCWQVEPPEDELAKAQELDTLADALVKLQTAGAPVDVRAVLESHGVPMISEAEQARIDAEAAAEKAAADAAVASASPTMPPSNGANGNGASKPKNGMAMDMPQPPQGA